MLLNVAPLVVAPLMALLQTAAVLDTQRVSVTPRRGAAGQVTAQVTARDARARGITDTRALLGQLPLLGTRSARGETGLSLRGARREQVAVTLDGVPLNDPATGTADVADLPMGVISAATTLAGADPMQVGAVGGTLALTTTADPSLTTTVGAFGSRGADGVWSRRSGRTRAFVAGAWRTAANDFAFVNQAGARPVRERRINNDEARRSITGGWSSARTQLMAIAGTTERGMVGPANVRTFDADRARTARVLVRSQQVVGATVGRLALRRFDMAYRDPTRPVLDAQATAHAADLDWSGPALHGQWQAGIGRDGLQASGAVRQARQRAFVSQRWNRSHGREARVQWEAGARLDAMTGIAPKGSAAAGVTWRVAGTPNGPQWTVGARAAQALRAPTLYDLYFSAPQRLQVRALAPERVRVDASLSMAGQRGLGTWHAPRLTVEGTLVSREVTNAIIWFPGNFGWAPANVGREQLRGVEGQATVAWPTMLLQVWGTGYRAELVTGPLRIPTPYVPRGEGVALLEWRPRQWTVSATGRVMGARPYTAGPRNPAFELPAVARLDMGLAYRLPSAARWSGSLVSLALDNATGVRWQSVQGFPMPGRTWQFALHLMPR